MREGFSSCSGSENKGYYLERGYHYRSKERGSILSSRARLFSALISFLLSFLHLAPSFPSILLRDTNLTGEPLKKCSFCFNRKTSTENTRRKDYPGETNCIQFFGFTPFEVVSHATSVSGRASFSVSAWGNALSRIRCFRKQN